MIPILDTELSEEMIKHLEWMDYYNKLLEESYMILGVSKKYFGYEV